MLQLRKWNPKRCSQGLRLKPEQLRCKQQLVGHFNIIMQDIGFQSMHLTYEALTAMDILRVDSDYFFTLKYIYQKGCSFVNCIVLTKERLLEFAVAKTGRQLQPQEEGEGILPVMMTMIFFCVFACVLASIRRGHLKAQHDFHKSKC